MLWSAEERATLIILGTALLVGLMLLWRQQQRSAIYVIGAPSAKEVARWDRALTASRQVDVNTANVAELERLAGIGPALAERIVAYRQAHGPFDRVEAITRVPGVGAALLEKVRPYLTVQSGE